jgi:hypothetical protein
MTDHPLPSRAQSAIGEIGAAHHQLGDARIELDRLNDLQAATRDIVRNHTRSCTAIERASRMFDHLNVLKRPSV